jgi:hypothetical protein
MPSQLCQVGPQLGLERLVEPDVNRLEETSASGWNELRNVGWEDCIDPLYHRWLIKPCLVLAGLDKLIWQCCQLTTCNVPIRFA